LVEFDPELVERAKAKQARIGSRLEVRCADAGDPRNFADVAPVDLLMLVGIFGNISDADIHNTVNAVPSLCKPGATALWGRYRRAPDLTPQIREWFDAIGCTSAGFLSPGAGLHSSASELVGPTSTAPPPAKRFTFVDDLW
jgi:hypothetical protein